VINSIKILDFIYFNSKINASHSGPVGGGHAYYAIRQNVEETPTGKKIDALTCYRMLDRRLNLSKL